MTNKSFPLILYWAIPILLWIAQLVFTANSNTQIRYEELADSIRNVFWLQQHKIYDGVSNGVGWYATLLIIYKLFGFSLFTAKYFRLFLSLVSLICLAYLLFKYLKVKQAFLPLLTIGLSPTMLFLNSTQTEYALDLQLLPIYLVLLISINLKNKIRWTGIKTILLWALLALGAIAYPTFVYYLPLFLVLFFWKVKKKVGWYLVSLVAFLLPLLLIFAYLEPHSRALLINDPMIHGGIFRGAGSFEITIENISKNLGGLFSDLFVSGSSYHFEVNRAEFSLIFPILALILVVWISFRAFKYNNYNNYNYYIILALSSGLAVLVLSSLTLDPSGAPGIRRYTPVLAAFYGLFVMVWQKIEGKEGKVSMRSWGGRVILGLLLVHHLIVYPINLVHLKDPSPSREPFWFSNLDSLVETVQKENLKLVCLDEAGTPFYCRISEVYAAVAGSCKWNKLDCHQILGWDYLTGNFIPLSTKLWDEYYFEH